MHCIFRYFQIRVKIPWKDLTIKITIETCYLKVNEIANVLITMHLLTGNNLKIHLHLSSYVAASLTLHACWVIFQKIFVVHFFLKINLFFQELSSER